MVLLTSHTILLTFQEHLLQNRPERKKETILKISVCYVAQDILLSIVGCYSLFV